MLPCRAVTRLRRGSVSQLPGKSPCSPDIALGRVNNSRTVMEFFRRGSRLGRARSAEVLEIESCGRVRPDALRSAGRTSMRVPACNSASKCADERNARTSAIWRRRGGQAYAASLSNCRGVVFSSPVAARIEASSASEISQSPTKTVPCASVR